MVQDVYAAGQQLARLGVCPCNQEHLVVQHVQLEAGRDEPRGVCRRGNESLAREVSTFLATYELVLEMNRGSTLKTQ